MKSIGPNISNASPIAPGALDSSRPSNVRGDTADSVFRDQLSALQNVLPSTAKPAAISPLKFSNHAIDRMQARGIRFSPDEMTKIEGAINKAASKGAKDTLLLTDTSALIVSVKDKTVVTVMDKTQLKDNVFTNIDSTVMI
ncbi:MAG: TIGR02530 family flagellar biosynthesis protein [Bdellovibrionales bacterium]